MSMPARPVRLALLWGAVGAVVAVAAVVAPAAPAVRAASPSLGAPPPEWAANAASWPSHNHDLANTRATTRTPISSGNVSKLRVKWRVPLTGGSRWGTFASNPIAYGSTIYVQDLASNVLAIDRETGRVKWRRAFDSPSLGPNGVVYGYGMVLGATATDAFALDATTGELVWTRRLLRAAGEGIDVAPQLYDNTVLVSTVPTSVGSFYPPGGMGIVWALDARTGVKKWTFNTVKDGDLWGNPGVNSGGGLWYPPAVDDQGRVFISVANPAPFPGTPQFPNGSSRPGPNLYTNSLVALDGRLGTLLWYQQPLPHDVRDHDLADSPILASVLIAGRLTDVVIVAGKSGTVYAYRADDGHPLWERPVGTHQNDVGPLPDSPVTVFPGPYGGVETPMALSKGRLFVPWVDLGWNLSSTSLSAPDLSTGRGGFTALNPATGAVLWERHLPQMALGGATVANDVVFTATYAGQIYAFDSRTGQTLWTDRARAGINAFPAVDRNLLLVGAGAPGPPGAFPDPVVPELIAYELPTNATGAQ